MRTPVGEEVGSKLSKQLASRKRQGNRRSASESEGLAKGLHLRSVAMEVCKTLVVDVQDGRGRVGRMKRVWCFSARCCALRFRRHDVPDSQ